MQALYDVPRAGKGAYRNYHVITYPTLGQDGFIQDSGAWCWALSLVLFCWVTCINTLIKVLGQLTYFSIAAFI